MKLLFITSVAVLLQMTLGVASEVEEGLCGQVPSSCSNSLQRKGICCKNSRDSQLIYFRNSCLACQHGCESYYYKTVQNRRCDDHELKDL